MLAGIVLVALNLRVVVAAVSPILDTVRADVPISDAAAGLLGSLPVLVFAVSAALAASVARRYGLEPTLVAATALSVVGEVARSMAGTSAGFLCWTVVALAGMGVGNVLLPPLVKRYFPDRIALVTAAYTVAMSFSTALPPLLAVPAAERFGWRWTLGAWAVIGAFAVVPWLAVMARSGVVRAQLALVLRRAPRGTPPLAGHHRAGGRVWRTRLGWGLALVFAMNSLNAYVMFAWLPRLLTDAGLTDPAAGAQLALYSALGLPAALVMPLAAARVRNPFVLVVVCDAVGVVGYLGLLHAPTVATGLWVVLAAFGSSCFPLVLALVGLRTRTAVGAVALSGFMQSIGYALAGAGPVVVGLLYAAGAGWGVVIAFLIGTLAVMTLGGWWACRPELLEDHWDAAAPLA